MRYLDLRSTLRSKVPVAIALLAIALGAGAQADKPTPVARQLTTRLSEFLDAAGRNDRAVFDRFFADDVIYTRATGVTIGKSEIMKSVEHPGASDAKSTFSAEDVTIHDYGKVAVVNFRLVAKTEKDGKTETAHYRNTATFLKRDKGWQVVAWQATKVPEKEE